MFGFLKDKIKDAVKKFSKKTEEEGKDLVKEETEEVLEEPVKEEIKEEVKEIKEVKKIKKEVTEEVKKEDVKEEIEEKEEPKKGILSKLKEKITTRKLNDQEFEDFFSDLELILMENNVALEVIDKIKESLKMDLVNVPLKRNEIEKIIDDSLKETVDEILSFDNIDLVKKIKEKDEKPYVIVFFGVNGSGKTTTIAKIANKLKENGLKCVLVAADTWRKAAIEQLEEHGKKLDLKVIKQKYGSDPAAVAFDGVEYGKAHKLDVVLIDTAGRQHSNLNLMSEMEKIIRVAKPNFKIFIGESTTGNDVVEQCRNFNDVVGINGVILTKTDVDEKGGAILSVSFVTGKPIVYLGSGQEYNNLENFNKSQIIKNLGL
ncbi:signal recognition particle-docking protein FtsY [archaeon]|nr:signal recognition particle-docking protein FtsY [archaeon]|tara:strand:- start:11904 stop:13025 length:1122 start_codon:yes stop_codon:yes gene_type:complete